MHSAASDKLDAFLDKWSSSQAAERANAQMFLLELCTLLGVDAPTPAGADPGQNPYVFERKVNVRHTDGHTAPGWIDLYKRDCFVLEAKQGSNPVTPSQPRMPGARRGTAVRGSRTWDHAMLSARLQAERYARSLPPGERPPPSSSPWTSATRSNYSLSSSEPERPTLPFQTRTPTASIFKICATRRSASACGGSGRRRCPSIPRSTLLGSPNR